MEGWKDGWMDGWAVVVSGVGWWWWENIFTVMCDTLAAVKILDYIDEIGSVSVPATRQTDLRHTIYRVPTCIIDTVRTVGTGGRPPATELSLSAPPPTHTFAHPSHNLYQGKKKKGA